MQKNTAATAASAATTTKSDNNHNHNNVFCVCCVYTSCSGKLHILQRWNEMRWVDLFQRQFRHTINVMYNATVIIHTLHQTEYLRRRNVLVDTWLVARSINTKLNKIRHWIITIIILCDWLRILIMPINCAVYCASILFLIIDSISIFPLVIHWVPCGLYSLSLCRRN